MDIEIIPYWNCVCINKRSPLKPSKYFGWCLFKPPSSFMIGLTKFVTEEYIIQILIHEITHILLYELEGNIAYSKFDNLDNNIIPWYEE